MTTKKNHPYPPEVIIQRQRRKSLVMRVSAAGEVIVQIPKWISLRDPTVKHFIETGLQKLGDQIPAEKRKPLHDARKVRLLALKWALRIGVEIGRVQLRPMTRKWGSCSSRGNITFNTSLFYLPGHLVEYVIVHELVHLLIFNHSPEFWAKVGQYIPNPQVYERELEKYRV